MLYGEKRIPIYINCLTCGNLFPTRKHRPGKYCSCKCFRPATSRRSAVCASCGIEFSRGKSKFNKSKSGLFFCSRSCKDLAQCIGGIAEIMPAHFGTAKNPNYTQASLNRSQCESCGTSSKFLLQIHHIDGNHDNDSMENLETLCGNCHITRHLKIVNGEFVYCTSHLTDRSLLPEIMKLLTP